MDSGTSAVQQSGCSILNNRRITAAVFMVLLGSVIFPFAIPGDNSPKYYHFFQKMT